VVRRFASLALVLGTLGALALSAAPSGSFAFRRILRVATGLVETVPLEEYVAAVLPAEIGNAPQAALEAQAIAARSYALAHPERHHDDAADLCDGVHCQVFRGLGTATEASRKAAIATRGLVLTQKGQIIAAPFHAVCGGHTTRPGDVWDDEEVPDIAAAPDDACLASSGARWSFKLSRVALGKLGARLGVPGARFLEVYGHTDDGRVSMLRILAPGEKVKVIRGFDFRRAAASLWGWQAVRSTAFELHETPGEYLLTGRGSGHGAGMCQAGAITRARRGETRDAILRHYYTGARVAQLASVR
jgi:stage II sporulation protein D